MMGSYSLYFAQPWWLAACLLVIPVIWLGRRCLTTLTPLRRTLAMTLRCLVIILLAALLARPKLTQENRHLALIAVLDRSLSVPALRQGQSLDYLTQAVAGKLPGDKLAVVDVAEAASISKLPSENVEIRRRNTTLNGEQSRLADGVQMGMAIAPPDTATRIFLISDGNETAGDLKEVARIAAANGIPIDVLPLQYHYDQEVIFRRVAAPAKARSGQTISLRFVLSSTAYTTGKLRLTLNGRPVDLAPDSAEVGVDVELSPGTNVKTVSLPVGSRGMHEFKAEFIPDDPSEDRIVQNNVASGMTFVAGPGHVLVIDADGQSGLALSEALQAADIDARYSPEGFLADNLAMIMDTDAIILVNTDSSSFSYQQQDMLTSYVKDLGGGLIMIGGNQSFGAGGWIGSPIADILPVDLDPPQKKQLPKGALVLIMHACEMPQGNFWGAQVAKAAVQPLSRLDLVGILAYDWEGGDNWVHPLSIAGDKSAVVTAINQMTMGDMPSLHDHVQLAYDELKNARAAQKHIIVISDGDPQPPSPQLLNQVKQAGITITGVGIFPHSPQDTQSLLYVARATGGNFYDVKNASRLPQIFIKEAQVVRRALIVEETFTPQLTYSLNEITKGLGSLPALDGYVLTGPRGGLNQVVLSTHQGDPLLATGQAGLGRVIAFTGAVDSRWASGWLQWPGFERFWEQAVRWAAKPAQATDAEVFVDVQGRQVNINVEALDAEGKFMQFANIDGQIISPDVDIEPLKLEQVGPGQYRGEFQAAASGSYIINLRYRKTGADDQTHIVQTPVTVPFAPEFRDLSDNTALLTEISEITGGRVVNPDPNLALLFDHAGVKFPVTQLPLTRALLLAWLAVFLLDVAIRRVAIDVKALARKVVSWVRPARGPKTDPTLQRLKATREKLKEQLKSRSARRVASARYEASDKAAGDLPIAKPPPPRPAAPAAAKEGTSKAKPQEAASHIQQLLKAKRQTSLHPEDDETEQDT